MQVQKYFQDKNPLLIIFFSQIMKIKNAFLTPFDISYLDEIIINFHYDYKTLP